LRRELGQAESVTSAIYGAGFNSNGRFYATANEVLGMTASSYKSGGKDRNAEALVRDLEDRFPEAQLLGGDAAFERLVASVVGFVEAPGTGLELPLDLRGTLFQQRVWRALAQIPAGTTASYTEIAHRIGAPRAVRAVAHACGQNPLAVAIPCHRVVRSDGGLSGYRWGIERKRALLEREADAQVGPA
jgi:AraC family transcriptional regulator of adaptative response/methylated-DNA-[protein]-cysteine methyltransferase